MLYAMLALIKTQLASIPGVQTCAIGLEATLRAEDYPIVRIVPSRLLPPGEGSARRAMEVLVYFGAPLLDLDGLEAVYESLLTLEAAILERMQFAVIQAGLAQDVFLRTEYLETITDEDRLPHYKLFAMRWRVEG